MAIILQVFTLPFILTLQVTKHALDLWTLKHKPKVLVVWEVLSQWIFPCPTRSFLLRFDGGGELFFLIFDLELMNGVE